MLAVSAGGWMTDEICRRGADVNACDYEGRTALSWAASKGNSYALNALIGAKPDLDRGITLARLHYILRHVTDIGGRYQSCFNVVRIRGFQINGAIRRCHPLHPTRTGRWYENYEFGNKLILNRSARQTPMTLGCVASNEQEVLVPPSQNPARAEHHSAEWMVSDRAEDDQKGVLKEPATRSSMSPHGCTTDSI